MIKFRLKADITFMADSIEDALLRLAEHFRQEGSDGDSNLVQSGRVAVGLVEDPRFDDSVSLDAVWTEAEAALPEGWSGPAVDRIAIAGLVTAIANARSTNLVEPRMVECEADTPAAALRALAAKLRELV